MVTGPLDMLAGQLRLQGYQSALTEDSWHRAVEFLFERLAVRWIVFEVTATSPKANPQLQREQRSSPKSLATRPHAPTRKATCS